MTLFLILLCSLLPTAPVLGPLQPPKSEVGVDNEGFTVADLGEGLGWPAPPPTHPGEGLAPLPSHIFLDQNEARSSSSDGRGERWRWKKRIDAQVPEMYFFETMQF